MKDYIKHLNTKHHMIYISRIKMLRILSFFHKQTSALPHIKKE